jgi:LysM repeat protein
MEKTRADINMKTFKFLTLLFLAVVIFGSAGYFGYELFIKPGRVEKREKAADAAAPAPTATPDPGLPEFQRLKKLQDSGKIVEARDGWNVWVSNNPKSPLLSESKKHLGDANLILLFQPSANPSLVSYTVVKGDSLAKIAAKQHSNAEIIQKANQLPGISLQIGQVLVIPTLKPSLELDRAAKTLTLLDNGNFLKEYILLSAPPAPSIPAKTASKVIDKIAVAGTKRVAFGDKTYPTSERTILLSQSPSIVAAPAPVSVPVATPVPTPSAPSIAGGSNPPAAAIPAPQPTPAPAPLPPGYVLTKEDLLEIFPLVSRNTPVIIH